MGFHIHLGQIITKTVTLVVAGSVGLVTGGPAGAGAAVSIASTKLAGDGLIETLHHLLK